MHPKATGASTVQWIFLVDSLNFSFWTDDNEHYAVTFKDGTYTGYMALCATINRAIEEGINLLDANVLVNLTMEDLQRIFRSDSQLTIPLIEERLCIMHKHGRVLLDEFSGCFTNCIAACHEEAARLLQLVTSKFPSFNDTAVFKGQSVSLHKRAQILIADLWIAFKGESFGRFVDIDSITAFADYRVPQVLVYFGVLEYQPELTTKLNNKEILENGSAWEVEIRGACLQAVEDLVKSTNLLLSAASGENGKIICNSIIADNFLWLYRRKFAAEVERTTPMHRTRCIYY